MHPCRQLQQQGGLRGKKASCSRGAETALSTYMLRQAQLIKITHTRNAQKRSCEGNGALRPSAARSVRERTEHAAAVGHWGYAPHVRPCKPALAGAPAARVLPITETIQLPELRWAANAVTWMDGGMALTSRQEVGSKVQAPDKSLS